MSLSMDIKNKIQTLLKKNQRVMAGNFFTVPSPERYPFQWLWDSCFHSFIYSALGETDTAKHELRSAIRKQHHTGLLPHITFWHPAGKPLPNWGRELRGQDINHVFGLTGTSSLTQPPLIARAVEQVFRKDNDNHFVNEMLPSLISYFEHLHKNRTIRGSSLLFIINPDESGEDNARRFDLPLTLSAETTASDHLTRRLELMEQLALCDFDTKHCMKKHFAVWDVSFNCVYLDGLTALSELLNNSGQPRLGEKYEKRAQALRTEMNKKLSSDQTHFFSRDIKNKLSLQTEDWTIFMPLYAGLVDKKAASILVKKLFDSDYFWSSYGIRTLSKQNRAYEPAEGFWRGPVWIAPHYFIYQGLLRYGFNEEAKLIKDRTRLLIEASGFREHYHGETGEGYGAHDFTWAGLYVAMD